MISIDGPISIARFMELAQDHPRHGYYRRRAPFGAAGDFTTAPEISQMFGEIVGLVLGQAWQDLGRPAPVRLVELGPGRGTMMADMLRAATAIPGLRDALEVHLVERSPHLQDRQRQRLDDIAATWHFALETVPHGPSLIVANEFVDALPVHQLVRTGDHWLERRIGLDSTGALGFTVAPAPEALATLAPPLAPEAAVMEVSPVRIALGRELARRVVAGPGLALLIDYGGVPAGPTGDTLQAVRAQRPVDPLDAPGQADISTQVDFARLAAAAADAGAAVYGPVPQGTFLRAFGIEARALRLLEATAPGGRRDIRTALFRLTDPSAMGELFKVLILASPVAPPPPGFSADA
jgi:NADH dehydrogenase [ubiquinone] 1 alpha subcomplex assembly factor 7